VDGVDRPIARGVAARRLGAFGLAILAAFAAAFLLLPHDPHALARVSSLPLPLLVGAIVAGWVLLTPALVSGTLLAAATGLLLGAAIGMPVALGGATLGAAVTFLLARGLGREPAQALAGARLVRLRERVERRPVFTIAVLRIAPGSPAALLSYAAGLTRMRLRHFVAAVVIGGAPRVLAYTALAGAAADRALWPALALAALIGAAGLAGTLLVRRRRRLRPLPAAS
jgi:phospholipase D1/2